MLNLFEDFAIGRQIKGKICRDKQGFRLQSVCVCKAVLFCVVSM